VKKEQIKRLLPSVFQRTSTTASPLSAVLDVMEAMHAPSEGVLDRLDTIFDPHTGPDEFVPYLASWVDLEVLMDTPRGSMSSSPATLSTGVGRLRELTIAAMTLSRWRGTGKGLRLFLETATGMNGFEISENKTAKGEAKPFHLCIRGPGQLAEHRRLIERIVELEKPAYATYELEFGPQGETAKATT